MPRDTIVYVDGFNLYYGALKNTRYRWLDLEAFARQSLSKTHHNVVAVKYFTAKVSGRDDNPDAPIRQALYLRALRTTPIVQVIEGHFLVHKKRMALCEPPIDGPKTVEVWRAEEKGSDVNLATHLLVDAFDQKMEAAVVVSNDSDLALPIQLVRDRFGLIVGVINPAINVSPEDDHPAVKLGEAASFVHRAEERILKRTQFAVTMRDSRGVFVMPKGW